MDLGPLLLLGFMWLVVNAIRKAGNTPPGGKRPPERPRSTSLPGPRLPGSKAPGARPGGSMPGAARPLPPVGGDATQREGLQLEDLLRQLGRTLDGESGPAGRAPDRRLPPAEEEEEVESLETVPEVLSLETDPNRPQRAVVDQDGQAEQVVARRLKAAEAHSAPRTLADHRAFDARIRPEAADKTATRGYTARQLRDAIVWREILGPPVSLRGEGEER